MRVLAITSDASLEVALSSLPGDWEITSARDPEAIIETASACDVAVIALGSTERGFKAMEDLRRIGFAIPCLVVGDGPSPGPGNTPVLIRPFSMRDLVECLRDTRGSAPPVRETEQPSISIPDEHLDEPASDDGTQWSSLLSELAEATAHPDAHALAQPVEEPAPKHALPAAVAPAHEATAARIVRHAAAAPRSSGLMQTQNGLHRLRKRKRVAIPSGGERAAMVRRVRSALEGARDLAALIEEIPALLRPDTIAQALVREVVELLGAETAALIVRDPTWRVSASAGLSPAERAVTVPDDQALLGDVAGRLEAVLVAPLDLVRGLVAGIPGTACDALILAPLEIDGTCHGVVLAGRDSFEEESLERMWLLAEEAAPGVAAASLINRLRGTDLPLAL